jgi:prepilin-type N-terminal cleavage/methylation domain-containing protein
MRPQRTERGFTLTELLLSITVLGIIVGALGSAFVVLLSNYSAVGSRAAQSHDSQLLSSWLLPDVQSAGSGITVPGTTAPAGSVDTNSLSAFPGQCSGLPAVSPSVNVVTMTWQDADTQGTTLNAISYRREGSAAPYVLARYVCLVGQPQTRNVVGHNVQFVTAALTTNRISIQVTSMVGTTTCPPPPSLPATDCYTFTVSANRLTAVPPGNLAPSFTSQSSLTVTINQAFTFLVAASGSPTPVISWSGALPGGVTLADNGDGTATMAGTPTTGGTYTLNLTATNGIGTPATQVFTLNVNQAPQFTSANNVTFTVGIAGSFTVTTSGYPLATMTESGALPTGISFSPGPGTATLSGTPAAGTARAYTLTLTATNTWGTANQTFTLTVIQKPVFTSPNSTTFTVGAAGSFTVTAVGPPAPALTESGALPSGVTFTAATGVLAGTPATGTAGVYTITFTATNTAGSTTQTFTLTVNQSPRITSPLSYWAVVNTNFSFTVTATGSPAPTFSETGALPAGVTLSAAGLLSGRATTTGTYPITITASNGVAPNATQAFTLTIANSTAPTITSPNSTTAGRNTPFTFTITTTGAPAPTLSVGSGVPSGVTFTNNGNGTATLSGTPTASNGTYTFTITASNGVNPNATQSFTLTISTAAAPTFTSTNHVTSAHGVAMTTFTVTTTGAPASALTVSTVGAQTGLPAGITFTDRGNGTGTLTGTPTTAGTYTFTITAANGVGANATQTFTFTVT